MQHLLTSYRLVWKRRRLFWRALRSRHVLTRKSASPGHAPDVLLCFMCVRNEMGRLPFALDYYRNLGVQTFFIVDNDSTDGTLDYLSRQQDINLWHTQSSYRAARFGLDWMNWLLFRYGHGHWCLHVDADELLVYAHSDTRDLIELTKWLDARRQKAFGALMLDLYPDAPLGEGAPTENPLDYLTHFDPGPYRATRQDPMQNLWVQGGARERAFFADTPQQSPTLNKLPLVRWNRRYAYVNSTHSMLPLRLNHLYGGPGSETPSGVLLHTKFLPEVAEKSREDLSRRQHFHDPDKFKGYYATIADHPNLHHPGSARYEGWQQLAALNLLTPGGFA